MSIDLLMNPSEPGDDAHESCRDVAISLRERAEKAERELRLWKEFFEEERDKLVHAYNRIDDLEEEREQQRAILARYEAPGPALLTAEHHPMCEVTGCGLGCNAEMRNAAYREQHARDVAVMQPHIERASHVPGLTAALDEARWIATRAVALLRMLDRPDARHPDVAEFLDGEGLAAFEVTP